MSAPDGDLERQTKNHRGPLRGMFAVVLFALVMLAILAFWAFGRGGAYCLVGTSCARVCFTSCGRFWSRTMFCEPCVSRVLF